MQPVPQNTSGGTVTLFMFAHACVGIENSFRRASTRAPAPSDRGDDRPQLNRCGRSRATRNVVVPQLGCTGRAAAAKEGAATDRERPPRRPRPVRMRTLPLSGSKRRQLGSEPGARRVLRARRLHKLRLAQQTPFATLALPLANHGLESVLQKLLLVGLDFCRIRRRTGRCRGCDVGWRCGIDAGR